MTKFNKTLWNGSERAGLHLQPLLDVLAEGLDDGEAGRVVVVEGVEGHAPVELALVVHARRLGAQVVDLVPAEESEFECACWKSREHRMTQQVCQF